MKTSFWTAQTDQIDVEGRENITENFLVYENFEVDEIPKQTSEISFSNVA